MAEFRVTWEIDVDAESPQEAAREAFSTMLDPDNEYLPCFTVKDERGNVLTVDLQDEEDKLPPFPGPPSRSQT